MSSGEELVERILAGDDGAVGDFVRQYQNLVRRIVFRIIADPGDREEVCQDTFLKSLRSLRSFRRESKLSTWIGRIAYRESIQLLRRYGSRRRDQLTGLERETLQSKDPSAQAILETKELEDLVVRAVDLLPPAQKTVVTLFYLEEMEVAEVARIIGVPVNTVKSHLLRSRQSLRALLEKEANARGYET